MAKIDKTIFVAFVTDHKPIYAKFDVYKKLDDGWYQHAIEALNDKNGIFYRGFDKPSDSLGNAGDIYVHITKDYMVQFTKSGFRESLLIEQYNLANNTSNTDRISIGDYIYIGCTYGSDNNGKLAVASPLVISCHGKVEFKLCELSQMTVIIAGKEHHLALVPINSVAV